MNAIILAAGRGSRLKGVAPPYHKPLVVVDGKPLVLNAVDLAHRKADRVVLVLAPENALPVCQLLEDVGDWPNLQVVVQRSSRGPGEAFLTGWNAAEKDGKALIMMGDNTFTIEDLNGVTNKASMHDECMIIGGRYIDDYSEAARYTRVYGEGRNARFVEGTDYDSSAIARPFCWCGPLYVDGESLARVLRNVDAHESVPELKLGRYLGYLDAKVRLVEVSTRDIGTQEAVTCES